MKTQEWDFEEKDRQQWRAEAGEWDHEPDKRQWLDPTTGLPCLIVRNNMGALCGYVGVPKGHPWHGKDYNDLDVDVHGGLTYSDGCCEDGKICHIVEPGEPDDVWWLGFDCAHAFDLAPLLVLRRDFYRDKDTYSYRNFSYVTNECEKLALQVSKRVVG